MSSGTEEKLDIACPGCLHCDVTHIDLGNEVDSDGEFGNHRIVCNVCGRRTSDMDTKEDAIEAFNGVTDNVHYDGADTILIKIQDLKDIADGKKKLPHDRTFIFRKDLRNRLNWD